MRKHVQDTKVMLEYEIKDNANDQCEELCKSVEEENNLKKYMII